MIQKLFILTERLAAFRCHRLSEGDSWKLSSIQAIFITEVAIYEYELLSTFLTGRWMLLCQDDKPDRLSLDQKGVPRALKCPCLEADHNVARTLGDLTHWLPLLGPGGKYKWVLACFELCAV